MTGNTPQSKVRSFGKQNGAAITTCSAKLTDISRAIKVHILQNMGTSMSDILQRGFDDAQGYSAFKNPRGARQRWEALQKGQKLQGNYFQGP